jgi:hypothetical protein
MVHDRLELVEPMQTETLAQRFERFAERESSTRLVHTNEVRRSACSLPAFGLVARRGGDRPLALVEIGASAGLNLLWDRYGYDYGQGRRYGDPQSPVQISCTPRGTSLPPVPPQFPSVVFRAGLDLSPIDLRDPDAALWLRALVWPEHKARSRLLQRAIDFARRDPPRLCAGDALDLLPRVLASAPPEAVVCVFHTHTVNQLSVERREQFSALIADLATRHDLFRVSIEWLGHEHPTLEVTSFEGAATHRILAYCDPHAEWLEWLQPDA